jgi:hypothetical protein
VAVATVVSTEASAVAAPRPTPGVSGATAEAALRPKVSDPVIVVLKDQTTSSFTFRRGLEGQHGIRDGSPVSSGAMTTADPA